MAARSSNLQSGIVLWDARHLPLLSLLEAQP